MRLDRLAEGQIRKAQAEGQLNDLKCAGAPLPRNPAAGEASAVGFRIMAEAGAVPEEVRLRREVTAQRQKLQNAGSSQQKREEMRKLADLELRLAIQEEARRKYY